MIPIPAVAPPVAWGAAAANNGRMSDKVWIVLGIVVTLLLIAGAQWYFDPPSPEICLDGRCYEIAP